MRYIYMKKCPAPCFWTGGGTPEADATMDSSQSVRDSETRHSVLLTWSHSAHLVHSESTSALNVTLVAIGCSEGWYASY